MDELNEENENIVILTVDYGDGDIEEFTAGKVIDLINEYNVLDTCYTMEVEELERQIEHYRDLYMAEFISNALHKN